LFERRLGRHCKEQALTLRYKALPIYFHGEHPGFIRSSHDILCVRRTNTISILSGIKHVDLRGTPRARVSLDYAHRTVQCQIAICVEHRAESFEERENLVGFGRRDLASGNGLYKRYMSINQISPVPNLRHIPGHRRSAACRINSAHCQPESHRVALPCHLETL